MSTFKPRPRIVVSFSGGRTSAYMAQRLKREYGPTHEVIFLFANTGGEADKCDEYDGTLVFVDRCDRYFGLNIVWLEAVINPERGEGTTHKVVDFQTASRNWEPFERTIEKYGIPNKGFPHCTRELKTNVMLSYARSLEWERYSYTTAIGIRSDEGDRMNENWRKAGLWYPLVRWGVTKPYILTWWAHQSFDLDIPEHHGNCVTCWKKSDRKLWTLARENADRFGFFSRMEKEHADTGAGEGGRTFFRRHRSVADVFAESERPFVPFIEKHPQYVLDAVIDAQDSCGESCEPWADGEAA